MRVATSALRMAFGGHFLPMSRSRTGDVPVIWLAYALIYRWSATRLTDARSTPR